MKRAHMMAQTAQWLLDGTPEPYQVEIPTLPETVGIELGSVMHGHGDYRVGPIITGLGTKYIRWDVVERMIAEAVNEKSPRR